MTVNTPEFIRRQYEFTRHCRDPENFPAPVNIEERRMAIYRDLLFNNIAGFMANNFPVIRKILTDDHWNSLIRDYFAHHKASTPLFPELPNEFLQFLDNERDNPADPPFLLELAHYERVESVLALDNREIRFEGVDPVGDLLDGVPVLNPLNWLLAYDYPVHRISPDFLPESKSGQQTFLVVYRDRYDKVGFMELNPVAARLVASLTEYPHLTARDHFIEIATELQHPQPQIVINGGLDVMKQMLQRDILIGIKAS